MDRLAAYKKYLASLGTENLLHELHHWSIAAKERLTRWKKRDEHNQLKQYLLQSQD